jgi:Ca-activated chloride channel family protein
MLNEIVFEQAYLLYFLALFILCHFFCPIKARALYYPHMSLMQDASTFKTPLLTLLKFIAVTALLTALAAPYKPKHIDITPKQGFDIALLLDASESMYERGFDLNNRRLDRFDVVKNVVSDFAQKRINDNLGVVVFGQFAFIAAPLTFDKAIISDIVKRLRVGVAGRMTAIYDALGQGVNLLRKSKAKTKIIILLTDGRNTSFNASLDDVLALAKKYEVKVYTIGIGREGEYHQILLQKIANETNGKMFSARSGRELTAVYDEIDRLEKSEIKSKSFEKRIYYYHYPLALAIVATLLYILLRHRGGAL